MKLNRIAEINLRGSTPKLEGSLRFEKFQATDVLVMTGKTTGRTEAQVLLIVRVHFG